MVGSLVSFWDGLFSGLMLVSGRVFPFVKPFTDGQMTSHDKFELLWGSTEISQNIFDQNDFAKQLSTKLSVHPSYEFGGV